MQIKSTKIHAAHIKQLQKESGISELSSVGANLISVTKEQSRELIGFGGSGICFTYLDQAGHTIGYRIKQDCPTLDENKKTKNT